jgi:hypothetical protein
MKDDGINALVTARVVIIVNRERPELYEYLREGFSRMHDVEVIMDRRIPDADTNVLEIPSDDGHCWQPDIYDELILRGFVVKRIE